MARQAAGLRSGKAGGAGRASGHGSRIRIALTRTKTPIERHIGYRVVADRKAVIDPSVAWKIQGTNRRQETDRGRRRRRGREVQSHRDINRSRRWIRKGELAAVSAGG